MAEPSDSKTFQCSKCKNVFISRNQLFKHIKGCGNDVFKGQPDSLESRDSPDYHIQSLRDRITQQGDVRIYILGGRLHGRTLKSVECFSFRTFSWEICPSMQQNRGSHGAAAIGEDIYVIGGGGIESNLSTCEKFNTSSNSWTFLPTAMNSYRHALSIVTDSQRFIYAVGGWEDGSRCSTFIERFDAVTSTWTKLAPMIVPRRLIGATISHGKIYVFGGVGDNTSDSRIPVQTTETASESSTALNEIASDDDPERRSNKRGREPFWAVSDTKRPSDPHDNSTTVEGLAMPADPSHVKDSTERTSRDTNKPVIRLDKDDSGWFSNILEVYDIERDVWMVCKSRLPFSDATSVVTVSIDGVDHIFVFIHGKGCYRYDPESDSYESRGPLPLKDWYNFVATSWNEYVFLHGGVSHGNWLKAFYMYSTISKKWIELPPMLRQRRRCAAAIVRLNSS